MSDYTEKEIYRGDRNASRSYNEKKEKRNLDAYASEKIRNLYSFLENVDSEQDSRQSSYHKADTRSRTSINHEKENYHDVQLNSESRSSMLTNKIELEEANKTIESLKKIIEREKAKNRELESQFEQREEKKLKEQKEELEETIQRHLSFIDQLVNDKRELGDQCEKLMGELAEQEGKHNRQMADIKEKYQREIKGGKDLWMAAEKVKRDKWIQEKTSEIKEMTIKGLEPELERIMTRSKQDIKKIEDKHQKELAEVREELYADYEIKLRQYKEKLLRDNDDALAREREYLSAKTKEQYDRIEDKYLEDRERVKKNYETQIDNVENERKREKEAFDEKIKSLQDENLKEIRRIKEEYEDMMEEQKAKYRSEISGLKDGMTGEQSKWLEKENKKLKEEFDEKLKKMRSQLERERDEQIEVIISKLGEENVDADFEVKKRYEKRIDEMKEFHEEEFKKLKREIYVLESQIKEHEAANEAVGGNLQVLSKKLVDVQTKLELKERESNVLKTALDSTKGQFEKMLDDQRSDDLNWRRKLEEERIDRNAEIEKVQSEVRSLKRKYDREIETLEEKHANTLEIVEQKVKKAIVKKDNEIDRLKDELQVKISACEKYEQLLEKQRRDLFNNM